MTDEEARAFDPVEFLTTREAVQAYLDEAKRLGDPAFIADAEEIAGRALAFIELVELEEEMGLE
jgi:DNA-binding phage protein